MKRFLLIIVFVFIPFSLFGEITFPESVYLVDNETGFKIMLGQPPRFIEDEYGTPNEKILIRKFSSGNGVWRLVYNDFEMMYETRDMLITYIRTTGSRFSTSKVKIGDSLSDIIRLYGNPDYTTTINNGELVYSYRRIFKEINSETEITTIQFGFINNRVVTIYLYIASVV